jgi:hypothetical protein
MKILHQNMSLCFTFLFKSDETSRMSHLSGMENQYYNLCHQKYKNKQTNKQTNKQIRMKRKFSGISEC